MRVDERGFLSAPLPPQNGSGQSLSTILSKLDCYRDHYRGRSAKVIQSKIVILDERQAFVGQIGLSQMLFRLMAADLLMSFVL